MHFLHSALGRELVCRQRTVEMARDHRLVPTEQLGHLPLRQPNRLVLEPHVEAHLPVGGLVEDDLAAGFIGKFLHRVRERTESREAAQG